MLAANPQNTHNSQQPPHTTPHPNQTKTITAYQYFCNIVFSTSGVATFPSALNTTGRFNSGPLVFCIPLTNTFGAKSLVAPASIRAPFTDTLNTAPSFPKVTTIVGLYPFLKVSALVVEVEDFHVPVMGSKMPIRRREDGEEERSGGLNERISAERVDGLYFISARVVTGVSCEAEIGWIETIVLSIIFDVAASAVTQNAVSMVRSFMVMRWD
jgi:hypothetical protein